MATTALSATNTPSAADATAREETRQTEQRNIATIARLEAAAMSERSPVDRVVDIITAFCGSMSFVYVHGVWFGFWIIWNLMPFVPKNLRFDPFPFQLLTLVVSLEAIFLSTFILISQNRQGRLSERRNHLDLQVNLLSEQESTKMLALLDQIARHLNVPCADDSELSELVRETDPEKLVADIQSVIEHQGGDCHGDAHHEAKAAN